MGIVEFRNRDREEDDFKLDIDKFLCHNGRNWSNKGRREGRGNVDRHSSGARRLEERRSG